MAISSKTPNDERRLTIEKFKAGQIQVLVNVDLFGEGFDCPDVEFIQLARPTLSLAKYLQQVGRGMRVFEGKRFCPDIRQCRLVSIVRTAIGRKRLANHV